MLRDETSPGYQELFGELDVRADDGRSVCSPAAYLVDLLALLDANFDKYSLLERRPDLIQIPLDAANTFTETPYLDIVNEVLERLAGNDPYETLRDRRDSIELPFSLTAETLRKYLHYLNVTPLELYRLFAARPDRDIAAREYLAMSPEDVAVVTTPDEREAELKSVYGLAGTESLDELRDTERLAETLRLTGDQLRELIQLDATVTVSEDGTMLTWGASPPTAWLDRTHRFVRLARKTGLTLTDLDLAVDCFCAGRLDLAALRALAVVLRLHRGHALTITEICQIAVPVGLAGIPGCSGDILAARNRDYRVRLANSIDLAESEIAAIVRRYRDHHRGSESGPFDRGEIGTAEIGLLCRAGRLAGTLGVTADELFDVLGALRTDPRIGAQAAQVDAQPRDVFAILAGGDPAGSLWLAETLFEVVGWMQSAGFSGRELTEVVGGGADTDDNSGPALIDMISQTFEQVAFAPALFADSRFGERAAKVMYDVLTGYDNGVVSGTDDRLLRLDVAVATAAAHAGLTGLGVIVAEDFLGLGLGERLQAKIFGNLVLLGHLHADGTLAIATTDGLRLATDFGPHHELVFKTIGAVADGSASFFLSDLDGVDGVPARCRAELYDNLIHNGYLDEGGDLTDPGFFLDPGNLASFEINADLRDVTQAVTGLLAGRIAGFAGRPLAIDPAIFAELRLTGHQLTALLDSLTFNGYLDENGHYRDKAALAVLPVRDFGLAIEFYPRRAAILEAVQRQILAFKAEAHTVTPEDFAELADAAASQRSVAALDGVHLAGGRVRDEALFAGTSGPLDLGAAFTQAEQATIFRQIQVALGDQRPYRVSPAALTGLGFTDEEADRVLSWLVEAGHLVEGFVVAEERLPYFRNVNSAHDFVLPGLEDYSKDVFFLLHAVAGEVVAAVTEVVDLLVIGAAQQKQALHDVLADAFGVPAATATAICEAVTGGPEQALDILVAPALEARNAPAGPHFRLAHRRIRRFALLAGKLGLDPTEIAAVFADQDLVGKFPENLALPPGVRQFDALLECGDGTIHLFAGAGYWTYTAVTYELRSAVPAGLAELSPRFEGLTEIDAAFTLPSGTEWIIGHTAAGISRAFTRQPGGIRWAPREQTWGKVKNAFADPARIDGAFADADGRTYLFSGEQYIRYSTADYTHVDEGYPRPISEWREREGFGDLPDGPLDAFQAPDGKIHTLTDATGWGRVRNAFEGLERVDAAHNNGSTVQLYSGDQVVQYSDSIENAGVRADEGGLRRISGVPARFETGVQAALTDPNGVLHLFKDGTTAAVKGDDVSVAPTSQRWGVLPPALPSGTVDAVLAGLDGKTYLFSGNTYLRYSAGDYTVVDAGYPRPIDTDWGGLETVDAAFVLDGQTYLFGVGGMLFELPVELHADIMARRLTPALRNRLAAHGFTLTAITGRGAQRSLQTAQGLTLVVQRRDQHVMIRGDGSRYQVRYSTNDYRTPDTGFPKPLSENWWNVPGDFAAEPVDTVFTGRDNHTYLLSGNRFIRFDARHRWWSEPISLNEHWDSVPFEKVDAAFVGHDGRTYLFSGGQYVRYSTEDYTAIDDQYPARIAGRWDNVRNNIERTGRVDATLVTNVTEKIGGFDTLRTYTYLFSGDQYFRYLGADYEQVLPGYPRLIEDLATEPGLGALDVTLDGVDAAFADRRTTYLLRGKQCYAVSAEKYRRYDNLNLGDVACAFIEDGSVILSQGQDGWVKRSAIEGSEFSSSPFRPRTLRTVPAEFRTGLNSVLTGADGNTYLFKGASCFNTQLNRAYPLAEEWGRPRNTIYQDNRVDAAFVGRDGKTYLFSGDQFVVHADAGATADGDPQLISEHWAGLTSVRLAYVRDGKTFLFERPDEAGQSRYVVYSGTDYRVPDDGFPAIADKSVIDAPEGFPFPDAVLFERDTMILLSGENCLSRNAETSRWSVVRPIERLFPGFGRGLDAPDGLRTAFTAADGTTWFFFGKTCSRFADGAFGPLTPVSERWGLSPNPFVVDGGTVDAAFVWRGEVTYLFSGDRYVRYTGAGYRAADPGYPKKTVGNLRLEEPFATLPESFDDILDRPVDAVIGNDRSIHLIVGGACHTVSPTATASFPIDRIGRLRDTIAESGKVDAALVAGRRVYLLSGDQYVRYSSAGHAHVDDGYPKPLGEIAAELEIPALPPEFQNGVDAAFRGPDGRTYLFRGKQFVGRGAPQAITTAWGKVRNEFDAGRLDAAFVAPTGELYAFAKDQFVRYDAAGSLEFVEPGFPRTVRDDWGDLPAEFESAPDGAFGFEGRTYLAKGERYVRYSGDFDRVDRTFPQEFQYRWSGTSDYRLGDVHTIVRFTDLLRTGPEGLAAFLVDGARDPYQYLGDAFGWDAEEVRWARRNRGLLVEPTHEEQVCEIEFLLKLVDVFATAGRLAAGPSEIHAEVWSKLHRTPDPAAAASAVRALLERKTGPRDWPKLELLLHNEINVLKRDALLAAVAPGDSGSRDLFRRYLIDAGMGPEATTSRIREAIAATQLYLHRYLLDLEHVELPPDADPDEVRARLRTWWAWMRNYRIWEANRKVFLYPENYLRPELRARKTPAFAALEEDLLQKQITAESVLAAYKRYLDEYTEVSRLAIAGGYVYSGDDAGARRLVLFGRTRTEPRRYYYRGAEFRSGTRMSATWEPWQRVDVAIDAERVDPVHAFGRVFVFWPTIEAVVPKGQADTTVTTTDVENGQQISAPPPRYQVKICYSFHNLNQEWVPAQVLAVDLAKSGPITGLSLYVQASRTVPGRGDHDSIIVQCTYNAGGRPVTSAFALTPELYGLPAEDVIPPSDTANLHWIFEETIDPAAVVRFNAPADTSDGPWVSVDYKGGSFLCRPAAGPDIRPAASPDIRPATTTLAGNRDKLPTTWERVDAGFELADGTRYFFDSAAAQYIVVPPDKEAFQQARRQTPERFGAIGTNLRRTGRVDAALIRGNALYLFSGDEYYLFRSLDLDQPDVEYRWKLEANTLGLPEWEKIDGVFVGPQGTEVFCSRAKDGYAIGGALGEIRKFSDWWNIPADKKLDAVLRHNGRVYAVFGDVYVRIGADINTVDTGYPRAVAGNPDGIPQQPIPGPVITFGVVSIAFDNAQSTYTVRVQGRPDSVRQSRPLGRKPTELDTYGNVTATYVDDGRLYIVTGHEFVRYTLNADGSIPDYVDAGYPKIPAHPTLAVLEREDKHFVFTDTHYGVLRAGDELDTYLELRRYDGNWRCLPAEFPGAFTGALDAAGKLVLFLGKQYAAYPKDGSVPQPYESAPPTEIIRLTSSTAYELNRRLLVGGIDALLAPDTQELDEKPAFSATVSDATTILVTSQTAKAGVPVGSHLDFDSSNGIYYWEIFFHAPMLIAQALNDAQRFEDARRWYEYVFDPTERARYWRFLPFLAVDVRALVAGCRSDLAAIKSETVVSLLNPILDGIEAMAPAFLQQRALLDDELAALTGFAGIVENRAAADLAGMSRALDALPRSEARRSLLERVEMIRLLHRQYRLMGDQKSLVAVYRDDPFDPHRIAELRQAAYRRTAVMSYIDNLLDWGDLLFRQYTAESIDEARMLYIFAYDLLGERPYDLGPRALPDTMDYDRLDGDDEESAVEHLTLNGALLEGSGAVHASVANRYFHVPDNDVFLEYWNRVEDRLRKIRASLDFLGVSRPLPLFEPPADVQALVRGAAAGASAGEITAALAAPVSAYRFAFLHRKAQELADRCRQLGADLLGAFERRDNEELALLQNRHEAATLALARSVKDNQVQIAQANLEQLRAARTDAADRAEHYEKLLAEGLSPLQEAQIAMMSLAAAAHFVSGGLKIGAAIASGAPQAFLGPFIIGTSYGGDQVGDALSAVAEVSESFGEGLGMTGELLGIRADQERQTEDWRLQLASARGDITQIGHQVTAAELQVAVAQRELEILDRETANLAEIGTFLTGKFAGAQLYGWLSGRLSGLYFQTYHLASEMARAAEKAYQFERGGSSGTFVQPTYWESKRNGLLAADSLSLDLDRLGQAYVTGGARSMEITRQISLLQLDPVALLALTDAGRCEFALTEDLFDRDFPGHYRRQIRTVSVTFATANGVAGVNATLTQLDNKTVLSPDPRAVKYLLDVKGSPPDSLRGDWRPSQQIALSEIEEGRENNGLFELRYDDDRYLPFEGTGAVSRWRLESRQVPAGLLDVTITVRYTAEQGGESFATAVRGMLRPSPSARYLDVAAEFPQQWTEFADGDSTRLSLPIAARHLPGIVGRQITGVVARYELAGEGTSRFLLNGDSRLALDDGKPLRTPGLSTGDWSLTHEGDKGVLANLGLILTYRAR
ncbi:MAG: hemopexin repeat-containing protein [Kibdelosporangium sp.]